MQIDSYKNVVILVWIISFLFITHYIYKYIIWKRKSDKQNFENNIGEYEKLDDCFKITLIF